jgi:hypothetical protein
MANIFHRTDIGVIIRFTVKDDGVVVDISGATAVHFFLMDPAGNVENLGGGLSGSGTDGKIQIAITSGTLDEIGIWTVQARVTQGNSPIVWTEKIEFKVQDILE